MDDKPPIRVLLVDDHDVVRAAVAKVIGSFQDMELVAQVTSGREAVEAFAAHQPDVTLMDFSMKDISGLEATRLILQRFPQARIIIMSVMVSTLFSSDEAMAAGALACLEKEGSVQQLADTIRRVYHGAGPSYVG